jgi:hypothetical protein
MSNVLIGIIGVILFIGLALAGALFLGPRFQESSNSSRAAAAAQAVTQVANAITLRNVETGSPMLATNDAANLQTLITDRYLKAAPVNPMSGSTATFRIVDLPGNNVEAARWVILDLGTDSRAKETCRAAEKAFGVSDPSDHIDVQVKYGEWAPAKNRAACINNFWSNSYMIFAPV